MNADLELHTGARKRVSTNPLDTHRSPCLYPRPCHESIYRAGVFKQGSSITNHPKKAVANQKLKKPGRISPTLTPGRLFFPFRHKPTATRSCRYAEHRLSPGGFENGEFDDHEGTTTEATNTGYRITKRQQKEYCYLLGCGNGPEYTVQHPDHGQIDVCGTHAENIVEIGGEVVELA